MRSAASPVAQLASAGAATDGSGASPAAAAVISQAVTSAADARIATTPEAAGASAAAVLDARGTTAPGLLYIETRLMYDLLHLTPDGYREWAACLLPAVERLMGGKGAAAGVQGERERSTGEQS